MPKGDRKRGVERRTRFVDEHKHAIKMAELRDAEIEKLELLYASSGKLTDLQKERLDYLKDEKKVLDDIVEDEQQRVNAVQDLGKLIGQVEQDERKMTTNKKLQKDIGKKVMTQAKTVLDFAKQGVDSGKIEADQAAELSQIVMETYKGEQSLSDLKDSRLDLESQLSALGDDAEGAEKELLEHVIELLKTKEKQVRVSEVQEALTGKLDQLTGGLVTKFKQIHMMMDLAKALAGDWLSILTLVAVVLTAGLVAGFAILSNYAEKVDKIGETFGSMALGLNGIGRTLTDHENELVKIGYSLEDSLSLTYGLSDQFGIATDEAANMAHKILDSGKAMGLNVEESQQLFGTLMSIGQLSQQQAEHLAESTYQLAAQNNVNPSAVMKDIAQSGELIAKFGAKNLDQIKATAVQAKKLGLNLSTVDKISSSLLNFQESISAEMEAEMMIGKDLELMEARKLMAQGKTKDAMDIILSQLGDENDFNDMNVYQREALAAALGVDVDEMAKLVKGTADLEVPKTFFELLGSDAQSGLTTIINQFKSLGILFLNEIGPSLEYAAKQFMYLVESNDLIGQAESFIRSLGESFEGTTVNAVDMFGAFMMKGRNFVTWLENTLKQFAAAAAGFILGNALLPGIGGLLGAAAGMAVGYWGLSNNYETMDTQTNPIYERSTIDYGSITGGTANDFVSRPGQPIQKFSGQDTLIGAKGALVNLDPLFSEIHGLRKDMETYFGGAGGGTVAKGVGKRVGDTFSSMA